MGLCVGMILAAAEMAELDDEARIRERIYGHLKEQGRPRGDAEARRRILGAV
jgi:hypothetical protein